LHAFRFLVCVSFGAYGVYPTKINTPYGTARGQHLIPQSQPAVTTMHIALLNLTFQLPGCHSLKEKRGRLRGMKDRFGKLNNLAVSETGLHDVLDQAQWSFLSLGQDRAQIDRMFSSIEQYAGGELDAVLLETRREWL
jgi:uncharacterized protein